MIADDFDSTSAQMNRENYPNVSALADQIYMLATEWVFGRDGEEGFPDRVYLRPFHTNRITTIQVTLESSITARNEFRNRASVFFDGEQVGLLTTDHPTNEFVVLRGEYQVRVEVGERYVSNEVMSGRLWNRVLLCRVEGDAAAPIVKLNNRNIGRVGRPQYPRFFTISSKEERSELARNQPFRVAAVTAISDAARMLRGATIGTELEERGWTRKLANNFATEFNRLGTILEETEWQLPRRLGDLGLQRWLSAYVPLSSGGSDDLQGAVLRASRALRALTAESEE